MKSRLLVLFAVLVPLAGCGGGGGGGAGGDADPAKLVPASAAVYGEVTVRPEGSKRDDAEAAAKKLLKTDDPAAKAQQLFDQAVKSDKISWEKDFAPWLGQRMGAFATDFSNGGTYAIIAANTNDDKAKETIHRAVAENDSGGASKVSKRTYKDVEYEFDATDRDAGGIVDGYAVVGSEAGFKLVVDTFKGGQNITANKDFAAGRDAVGADDSLANVWANPQTLLDAVGSMPQSNQAVPLLRQVSAQLGRTAAAAFHASGDSLRMDFGALGAPESGSTGSGADVAAKLPSDAWLAIGVADLGKAVRKGIGQVTNLGNLGGVDVGGAMSQFESQTGLNLQRDLLSWIKDAAFYARGKSLADLGVVFTATSSNPDRSNAAPKRIASALHKLGTSVRPADVPGYKSAYQIRLPGFPVVLFVAGSDDRVSIGVNPKALSDVANAPNKLGDSPAFDSATNSLGDGIRPSVLVDFPTVVQLLEGIGLGNNPDYKKAKPYLDSIGVISAGGRREGDTTKARLAVGLR